MPRKTSIGLAVVVMATGWVWAEPRPREGALKVGDPAPAFELTPLGEEKPVTLAGLKGKPVVLIFGSCT